MIKSWGTETTRRFAETGKAKFSGIDEGKALARLQMLDATASLEEILPLKSIGLHKLDGDRVGQWAMTINGPWRLVFFFRDGHAFDVEITDYHKG
ncbi:MAG: type II toxin-antitoxin system RelE/ParE family toxin [Azospirillaceae bacterium]|nr:type II toxin-antitoxin system RelE/ParE family toxin [Azospirillaceae bacterium]